MRAAVVLVVALLASAPACLVVTTEGTPLAQGYTYECTYKLHNIPHGPVVQCGPIGDTQWVFDHFDYEADTQIACHAAGAPCIYEPDHLGWREFHSGSPPENDNGPADPGP